MKKRDYFLNDRLEDSQVDKFKLFEDEELIFATREHWLMIVLRLVKKAFISLIMALVVAVVLYISLQSISLTLSAFFLIMLIGSSASVRDLIHWSFHLYIATNRQIIEVHYSPLLSESINSVLLDQIRCTEIDVEMYGLIPELIGIGNVALTFDRPTHKEEFVIRDIRAPRTIANLLSAQIHQKPNVLQRLNQPFWVKELKQNKYKFLGDSNYGNTFN